MRMLNLRQNAVIMETKFHNTLNKICGEKLGD
jgi:hypothetical protein